jgi:predicted SAM-dependent methyltransferase
MSKKNKTSKPEPLPLRLNFGCGQIKVEGFVGVDLFAKEADIKADLTKFPLPWKDNSVDSIMASHFVEHIEAQKRWPFFDECWRILKPGGLMQIVVPNFKSDRAYGDVTHQWPPFTAFSFLYLNRAWREANKLTHGAYALKCDFDHQCGPAGISQDYANRSHDAQMFALRSYWESYQDLWCNLTKKA